MFPWLGGGENNHQKIDKEQKNNKRIYKGFDSRGSVAFKNVESSVVSVILIT